MTAQLHAKLLDKEQELNAIFEGVPLMMILLDNERRVLRINRQAVEFIGRPEVLMLNRCFGEAVGCAHAEESEKGCGFGAHCRDCRVKSMATRAFQLGESEKEQEVQHQFKVDGQLREVTLSVSAIPLTIQENPSLLMTFQDITAQRAFEEEVQQAQRLDSIGTLASGIAHDFNNILSAITGYTDLAINGSHGNQQVLDDLAEVRKAASRAVELVRKILTFSRRHRFEKIPIQVADVVSEVSSMLRAMIPSTIDIRMVLASTTTIMADPTQIHQLVMNLCTNAYHAMIDSGGTLNIGLWEEAFTEPPLIDGTSLPPGRYVTLSISDTGHGMPPKVLARIFEPYFTTKETGKGSGLGLAMAHGIVSSLHGRISVASVPEQGTTFTVYLPANEASPTAETMPLVPDVTAKAQGQAQIMMVDDEAAIRDVVRRHLEMDGYRVNTFANGQEALEALLATPAAWDILVTDQNMPGLDGAQLAAKAHALRPGLPIIICSGFFSTDEDNASQQPGVFATLSKPVEYSTLLKCINEALCVADPTVKPGHVDKE